MSDATTAARSELRLRIEAANLVDHVLRLEAELKAERASPASRIAASIDACASALRGAGRTRVPGADIERCAAVLLKSGLFDAEFYLRRNRDVADAGIDPVMHYLRHGAAEMRDPGPHFSTQEYLRRHPEIAGSGVNPLYHFIVHGYAQGFQIPPRNTAALSPIDAGLAAGYAHAGSPSAPAAKSRRLVVYTALFDDYDDLFVPTLEQAESCDFVVFTDRRHIPPPWRRGAACYAAANGSKANRFYKLLPHRLFADHEWSLYLDGNVDLQMDPIAFLDRHCGMGPDFFVFRHPTRTSILEELAACIDMRKDDPALMVRQVADYLTCGFQQAFALTHNHIMLRRHNEPRLTALGEAWWAEVRSKSQRDQLSLSYVVEKQAYEGIALFDEGATARHHPGLRLRPHRAQSFGHGQAHDALA